MKKMTITGALAGFGLGLLSGLLTEWSAWSGILWRASVSALVCSLLFRWWTRVLTRSLAQSRTERLAALRAKQPPVSPFTR